MQAARRGAAASMAAAASFHSTPFILSKSTPNIRFAVREKRADAKTALNNLLLNGSLYQENCTTQKGKQKGGGKSKLRRHSSSKNQHSKSKRGGNWRNFEEDDFTDATCGSFGGKRSFNWYYWPGDNDGFGGFPSGFQWREEPQPTKSRERIWNESDVDEEEESDHVDLQNHRISLGLPPLGPLKLDHIKSAFRASALKWHPDKHQGPSQVEAEEKFKRCVEAYNALAGTFK